MMNKYLIVLEDNRVLRANLRVSLYGNEYDIPCKIDTGCGQTVIPIRRLVSDEVAVKLKKQALEIDQLKYHRTYGVSDTISTRERDTQLLNEGKAIECTSLHFRYPIKEIAINGYRIPTRYIGINYDRTGNILIGMDILKMLDIHMGTDSNGEFIMLACDKDKLTLEYLQALKETFGIVKISEPNINANYINDLLN